MFHRARNKWNQNYEHVCRLVEINSMRSTCFNLSDILNLVCSILLPHLERTLLRSIIM